MKKAYESSHSIKPIYRGVKMKEDMYTDSGEVTSINEIPDVVSSQVEKFVNSDSDYGMLLFDMPNRNIVIILMQEDKTKENENEVANLIRMIQSIQDGDESDGLQ